jgi:hypothetical protein
VNVSPPSCSKILNLHSIHLKSSPEKVIKSYKYGKNTCSQSRCFKDQHSVPFRARYSHVEVSILLAKITPVGSTTLKDHDRIFHSTLSQDSSGYDTGLALQLASVYPLLQQVSLVNTFHTTQLLTGSSLDDVQGIDGQRLSGGWHLGASCIYFVHRVYS